jgi:hypothetical protein
MLKTFAASPVHRLRLESCHPLRSIVSIEANRRTWMGLQLLHVTPDNGAL